MRRSEARMAVGASALPPAISASHKPIVLVLNKADLYTREELDDLLEQFRGPRLVGFVEPENVVAVSAAHRKDAFPAAQFIIDELKARVPIWKKEHWSGGAEWVEGA